jgi:hypothetical protein
MSQPDTMRPPAEEVLAKALQLDEQDRARVAEALLESLEIEDPGEEAVLWIPLVSG